ncbi:MAG: 2-(1,2-epoxy-1,2-dihydrophenyl)acetyl-CoA isomerase, partial [Bacteroidetes bacterium]
MDRSEPQVLVSQDGYIKTLTLHQPHKKNAITRDMSVQLLQAVQAAAEDDSRVIILTGSGQDFCAGADLDPSVVADGKFDVTEFLRTHYNTLILTMREMDKIFIARVQGSCVGVGFNFALACDLILAGNSACFSQIFTRIGLSSDGGGAWFMQEKLGYHKAMELMLTHRMITAAEAADWGLINRCLPDEALDQAVAELAGQIAQGPFLALQHTKSNLRAAQKGGLAAALEQEALNQGINFRSRDFMEGVMAFLQRRAPKF